MGDKKLPVLIFGETLQALRKRLNLTQDQVAERACTERSHISALERGEKGPLLGTIFSLADALEIPASELIGLVETRLQSPNAPPDSNSASAPSAPSRRQPEKK